MSSFTEIFNFNDMIDVSDRDFFNAGAASELNCPFKCLLLDYYKNERAKKVHAGSADIFHYETGPESWDYVEYTDAGLSTGTSMGKESIRGTLKVN